MADERIWTAEEVERLTPDERDRLLNERVVTDLSAVPKDLLARARARGKELLDARESTGTNQ